MIEVDFRGWKQLIEGMRRRSVVRYEQRNRVDGDDCIREYLNQEKVVARLTVYKSNTDALGSECERKYELSPAIIEQVKNIFIPTQEQWDEWDDSANDLDGMAEAAKIDPGWLL